MIRTQRKQHLIWWMALALLMLAVAILGIALRPDGPPADADIAPMSGGGATR